MMRKVSELRLGDVLAEPPIVGSIIGLKLRDDSKVEILFVNVGLDRDAFEDLEIRHIDDYIEVEAVTVDA